MFSDGGWFASGLRVQVRRGGVWSDVGAVSVSPAYPYSSAAGPNHTYTFTFPATSGDGVRIIGAPGGTKTFTSIGELAVSYTGSAPPAAKYWADTYASAPVYASPTSTTQTGTLNAGTNYVYCKLWGRMIGNSTTYNHWWLRTDPDIGPTDQYISAYYLSHWGNDEAKDNGGAVIPDC